MAKKKKKNKIKSFLKKAAPLAALALGASALGRRGIDTGLTKGKFLMSGAAGGTRLPKPFSRVNMRDIAGSGDVMPDNLSSSMGMDRVIMGPGSSNPRRPGINNYYKKGGRVGCGVAKKGFGRAMPKGRKK